MEEAEASRYWCHLCSEMVNPIMEIETIKCPICQSGFIEEMASAGPPSTLGNEEDFGGSGSERDLSMRAPILLGMLNNPPRLRRVSRMEFMDENENSQQQMDDEVELEHELETIIRRRRRNSAAILQLFQGIRAGLLSDTTIHGDTYGGDPERVILMNNRVPIGGSIGDYFSGPGLETLLQHLAENDPNRYGTPPALKEAVEALPTLKVKIEETPLQCCVCLDECEIGSEVKEMPCKHKFHRDCILPWLELHSSCPVCRYQLPSDESKPELQGSEESRNNSNDNGNAGGLFSGPLPWPLSSLFSSSSSSQSRTGGDQN